MSDTMLTSKRIIPSIVISRSSEGTTLSVTFSGKTIESLGYLLWQLKEELRAMGVTDFSLIESGSNTQT